MSASGSTRVLPWAIAATPLLPVITVFAWHPRTWLESPDSGPIDPAFVAVLISLALSVAIAAVLARVDARRLRHPLSWRSALLGAPVYLRARSVALRGAWWPVAVSAVIAIIGLVVVVQKLVDAAQAL